MYQEVVMSNQQRGILKVEAPDAGAKGGNVKGPDADLSGEVDLKLPDIGERFYYRIC